MSGQLGQRSCPEASQAAWDGWCQVLILAKITGSSAGGYAEYLEGKVQASALGDYYLKDGERIEAPGRWAGGAKHFGLDQTAAVTGEQLRTLMAVQRPDNGEQLRRTGGSGEAVAAIDATFSAPKSVSAAWAIAGPELRQTIEVAHELAVDRALRYATQQVPMLRRRVTQTKVLHEKATGLVATSWRHTTARAVANQVPDPQLHSHVLLHAAVRRDGRLVAIDSRSLLVHQREVGAAYRTELAHDLQALGFTIQRGTGRGSRYFELDAIPRGLLDRWSSRHHQVQAAIQDRLTDQQRALETRITAGGPDAQQAIVELEQLRETGRLSPKQERLMGTVTRTAKQPVTVADLDSDWQRTALQHRVSRERLEVLRLTPKTRLETARPDDVLVALTEFDSTFAAREARAAALEQSAGTPIAAALEQLQALRSSGEILLLADGTGTTKDHRGYERAVVAITHRLANTQVARIPEDATALETKRLDGDLAQIGGHLSDEQRTAIQLACGEHPLVVIEGHAGTGKSTTLTGIARAHQDSGRQIIVTSTAALAAERLATELQEHGVECSAYSTAGLHAAINHGRVELDQDTTVIHDEAALASTREQLRLLRAVETSGARLIAVGDPQQNQPVGAGGLWEQIENTSRDAGAHVELTVNQRAQHPADRHAQTLFRKGEIELALRTYAARDRLHTGDDQQRVEDQALEAAHQDRADGKTTIVIAQTSNEHLDELNARAQAIRKQAGQLSKDGLDIPGRPYQLHAGDEVQVRHTITHPEHGPLHNGTAATVTDVDPGSGELVLRLADGNELTLDEEQIEQADLRLAYVQHPFPAQGHTTDTTHVIVGGQATREGTYVAITRAREHTHIYAEQPEQDGPGQIDRLQELADRVSRTEPEMPSISTPLAHEETLRASAEIDAARSLAASTTRGEITHEPTEAIAKDEGRVSGRRGDDGRAPAHDLRESDAGEPAVTQAEPILDRDRRTAVRQTIAHEPQQMPRRAWPGREAPTPDGAEWDSDRPEQEQSIGWEM
jgi:conjugative relaxase-like TrwC/TraI family protein